MNPRIRWVGVILLLCFGALFIQLNNIQVRQASALSRNPLAQGPPAPALAQPRGAILSANLKILAYSKKVKGGMLRVYPAATAVDFGQITGYVGATGQIATQFGIEAYYQRYLAQHQSAANTLSQLVTQHQVTDNVILTVPSTLQADAAALVKGHPGAEIVALNPRNGDILAMDGSPSYNPNALSSLNIKAALKAYNALAKQPLEPFLNLASAVPYQPGSAFKIITTSAIFDHKPKLALKRWPFATQISLPGTPLKFHNYAFENCGGPLAMILAQSCDTAYAEVSLALGARTVVSEAQSFGWCQETAKLTRGVCAPGAGSGPPLDLPPSEVVPATMAPEGYLAANPPFLAYSAIGQLDDAASALSMALTGAAIANNGNIMAPHLMHQIIDSAGNLVKTYHPHVWKHATSRSTAVKVRQLMLGVTQTSDSGTAGGIFTNLQSLGIQVAAKTGTAEAVITSSTGNCATFDWLVAMAPAGPGQVPTAVVVAEVPTPNGATNCAEATGASVAGPLVDQMLTDVLKAGL
ncbi:MAG: penicillin-binding transpeptidase domain-containing protein [Acidimicrobiales bacterium]